MEKTLYDKKGEAVAYLAMDYRNAVFLWDGDAAAYLYEGGHVYGINGQHLGWFIDDILYDQEGVRIGFTSSTLPDACRQKRAQGQEIGSP